MALDPISSVFDLGKSIIERIWPDANSRAIELRKLEEIQQRGDLAALNGHIQKMLGQMRINEAQAKSRSLFVAGARPFIMWVCGFGLAFQFLFHPLLIWVWSFAGLEGNPPEPFDMSVMMPLLLGMLGLGTMRSVDKRNGVETNEILKIIDKLK